MTQVRIIEISEFRRAKEWRVRFRYVGFEYGSQVNLTFVAKDELHAFSQFRRFAGRNHMEIIE